MASVSESVVVEVPVRTAYNQWTQFEEFPKFMEGLPTLGSSTTPTSMDGGDRRRGAELASRDRPSKSPTAWSWRATDGKERGGGDV